MYFNCTAAAVVVAVSVTQRQQPPFYNLKTRETSFSSFTLNCVVGQRILDLYYYFLPVFLPK